MALEIRPRLTHTEYALASARAPIQEKSMFRIAAIAAVLLGLNAAPAAAANVADSGRCMELQELGDYLRDAYAEHRLAVADHENGNRIFLYTSRRGTWTLVEMTEGLACVNASGTGWHGELSSQADAKPPA